MTDKDAIEAAQRLMDYCESFVMCEKCVFCLNPHEEAHYKACFFRDNTLGPSFWWKFLEAKHGENCRH